MKPFNLEQARAGKPVVTEKGRDVDIMRFDVRNKKYPLMGIISGPTADVLSKWTPSGEAPRYNPDQKLYMRAESRDGWVNLWRNGTAQVFTGQEIYPTETAAQTALGASNITRVATIMIKWNE